MDVVDDVVMRLEGVSKVFETDEVDTFALSEIDLTIRRGEFVAVEGPSGCGKSTLLAIMGLLDVPTKGAFWLSGEQTDKLTPAQRARLRNKQVGIIFQSFNLIGDLTVHENVELPLTYRPGLSRVERRQAVTTALDRVGLGDRSNHYPAQLSGGQQQRTAVARALAGRPAVLLADEPTGNLDSQNGESVMNLLRDLHASGATICMVTHEPRYAMTAQRLVRLHDGKIVAGARDA